MHKRNLYRTEVGTRLALGECKDVPHSLTGRSREKPFPSTGKANIIRGGQRHQLGPWLGQI